MEKIKMAEKLWDLANLLTGFAVVQSIATTFTVAKGDLESLVGCDAHFMAMIVTLVFTIFYIIAILWCCKKGSSLDSKDNSSTWRAVKAGRVFAVVLFTLVTLGTFYGHWNDELKGKSSPNPDTSSSLQVK